MPLSRALLLSSLAISITNTCAQDQTARLVKDANRYPATHGPAIKWISPAGKGAVFTMDTLEHGPELWTTNGTPKGTRLLRELVPGPTGVEIFAPTTFGPADALKTAFTYRDPVAGKDVWVTDGTEAGTLPVYQPPANRNTYTNFGTTRGFFFTELTLTEWPHEDPRYEKVFFSDGTPAGTRDLSPITGTLIHSGVSFVDGPWAYLTVDYNDVWRSDGTAAGTTRLVTSADLGGSGGFPMGIVGGRLLITSYRPDQSTELWTCSPDGGDLTRVTSAPAGHQWYPSAATRIGERIFFPGDDDHYHLTLWVTDGTAAGTRQIALPYEEGKYGSYPVTVVPWRGSIYISTSEPGAYDYSTRLFRANADLTEVTRLGTFPHGVQLFAAADWREDQPYFYFQAATSSYDDWKLWRTKGDLASTKLAKEVPATNPLRANPNTLANTPAGKIYAVADKEFATVNASSPLYRQRGKHGSAQRLTKPEKWNASGVASFYYDESPVHEITGKYLLEFVDTGRGQELWRMNPDGTGARALWSPPKPIDPSYGALSFRGTTPGGAIFLYREYSPDLSSSTVQLWTSDGTRPGTRLLLDYSQHTEEGASLPENFVQVGDTLFYTIYEYSATTGSRDYLWKTDGTPEGTTRVLAEDGRNHDVDRGEMVSFQGALYYLTPNPGYGTALWRTDGTPEGTSFVTGFYQRRTYGYAHGLSVVGGKLLCFASPSGSYELWQSDGTWEGTEAIDSPVGFWSGELRPIDLGSRVIFRGMEAFENSIEQWWCYDAVNGTRPLLEGITTDQFPPPKHSSPEAPWHRLHAATGTRLFYATRDGKEDQFKLHVTDGTSAGTRTILTTGPYPQPLDLFPVGDVVYFINHTDTHGRELWRSDGTEEGTVLAADINPGAASSNPEHLKLMNGKLYFTAERRDVGRELFVIDLPAQ